MNLFTIFLGVTLLLGVSLAQGCRNIPSGSINQDWFLGVEKDGGWDQPLGSKFDPPKPGMTFDLNGVKQPKGKNEKCFKTNVKISQVPGEQTLDLDCRYDKFDEPSCIIHGDNNPVLKDLVKFNGDFVFTKSDDSNYAVVFGCIMGKIKYWVAMVPIGKEIAPYKQEILDHVREVLGMSTDEKDLKSEDDPFLFKSFNGKECKGDGLEKEKKKISSFKKQVSGLGGGGFGGLGRR